MKNHLKTALWSMALILFTFMTISCKKDDEPAALRTKVYTLETVAAGVGGTVTFTEVNATSTTVTINLTGAPAGGIHPAHIHSGNKTSNGPIVFPLTNVVNSTSTSTVAQSYDQLLTYNGYVNVHLSATAMATIVATTNIGSNK